MDSSLEGLALVLEEEKGIPVISRTNMKYLKAIWQFLSYVFWPQWGKKTVHGE